MTGSGTRASGGAAPARGGRGRRSLSPRQELAALLLLGAAGAGLVFLAMRQGWAQVRTAVPAPLPDSVVTDSGQSLLPYADALAFAALASLAAVLATRRLARRATGVLLAALGAAIAAAAAGGVSASAALAAAAASLGPATGSGAGSAAGSVTEGSAQGGSAVPDVTGFHAHAVITAAGWQALAIAGAVAIMAAGVLVTWRAGRLPVMSSRYDAPAGAGNCAPVRPESPAAADDPATGGAVLAGAAPGTAAPGGHVPPGTARPGTGRPGTGRPGTGTAGPGGDGADVTGQESEPADAASMWESLSRGEDPTAARPRG
jgi:uncharacterized membrane protein (TIGR02234 family)